MKTLYIDCGMGIAGDMLTSSLLGLFENPGNELKKLNRLGIPGVEYKADVIKRQGIAGIHTTVQYNGKVEGQAKEPGHHHVSMEEILRIIHDLSAPDEVKDQVGQIYALIAEAESRAHGMPVEEIHLHELGAMDAIADIAAAAFLIHELSPDLIISSPVRVGYGTVHTAHGLLPVPAPATAFLLEGIPCYGGDVEGEMCTPTGAALLKHYAQRYSSMPQLTMARHCYGMGAKEFEGHFNAVRAILGTLDDQVVELQCNVDDMTPEEISYALDQFLREGALDAYWESIGMKKGRPGIRISVLCKLEDRKRMVDLVFLHTSTIGIREALCVRDILKRESGVTETRWGPIRYKISEGHGVRRVKPEFDDLSALADRHSQPIHIIRHGFEEDFK